MLLLRLEGLLPTCASLSFAITFVAILCYAVATLPPGDDLPSTSRARGGKLHTALIDCEHFRPVVLVTIGWSALYFSFLHAQNAAAFWVHKARREAGSKKEDPPSPKSGRKPLEFADVKYGRDRSSGGLIFTMDRTVGNMLEQTPPFLVSIWLHALTVSPTTSAYCGWSWLLLRALYPVGFAHPSMSPALWEAQRRLGISWVSFITWPSYTIVWYLLFAAARSCW